MPIQTLDQIKQEQCWDEVKAILAKHGLNLNPKFIVSPMGVQVEIQLIPVSKPLAEPQGTGGVMVGA